MVYRLHRKVHIHQVQCLPSRVRLVRFLPILSPLYEKDYELIKKLLATKKYYTFVYIGKRFRQSLVDYGVWGNGDGLGVIDDENSLSIMYYHGNFSYGWGPIDDALFTEEGFYPYHVGEALIMCVASDIRENR